MKKLLLTVALISLLLGVAFADKPLPSGTVASMSSIHMDINNIFFDRTHHFSVTVFDAANAPIANEPCVYYTEYKATGNVLQTFETKPDCVLGISDCYYTTNADGNLFGQIDISDAYYDIGREYTLRVSCDTVTSSIDFNVATWKAEQTGFDFAAYLANSNLVNYGIYAAIFIIFSIFIIAIYKLVLLFYRST